MGLQCHFQSDPIIFCTLSDEHHTGYWHGRVEEKAAMCLPLGINCLESINVCVPLIFDSVDLAQEGHLVCKNTWYNYLKMFCFGRLDPS